MLEEDRAPEQSTRLGQYEILERIGQGGMGTVYRARHVNLGSTVALKVLSPRFASDAGFVARFRREAKAAATLSHPNIVRVTDAGEERGLHYIVMEFVDGTTLAEVLSSEGKIDVVRALDIVQRIAEALVHAEEHRIVHRDITPANIMLTKEGEVKLADLGLAKRVGSELATGATETGASIGTPYYMSPEQVVDSKNVDYRSDIYSLGATLYHLVSGRRPFDAGSAYEIMRRVETEEPVSLAKLDPKLPRNLCNLVERMMAKRPAERYGSARELLAAIERVQSGMRIPRFRRRIKSLVPIGDAKTHWKGALVAGLSAALVGAAIMVGFLWRFRRDTLLADEPSVVTVPTRNWENVVESDSAPRWKTTLPTDLPAVEEKDGRYTVDVRRSSLSVSAGELTATLEGAGIVLGEFFASEDLLAEGEPSVRLTLQESPDHSLIEASYLFPSRSARPRAKMSRQVVLTERELLVAWELNLSRVVSGLTIGLELSPSLFAEGGVRIDDDPGATPIGAGEDAFHVKDAFSTQVGNRTLNFVIDGIEGAQTRLERTAAGSQTATWRLVSRAEGLPAGKHRIQVLITSIPVIRRERYTAYLANGQIGLLLGDERFLLSDSFDSPGLSPSRIIPTDYYRSDEGDYVYIFATPSGRDAFLVKSLRFAPDRIEIDWRWMPAASGEKTVKIALLLEPETILGKDFYATLEGGEEVTGTLSSKTLIKGITQARVDLGGGSVSFELTTSLEVVETFFDGKQARFGGTFKASSDKVQRAGIRFAFSNDP